MSYTGQIAEIPLALEGLTGNKNLSQVRVTQLLDALNVSFDRGTIQKEGGATKYNTIAVSGTPTIQGGWDWFPSTNTQRMVIFTSDGNLYKDSGSGTFPVTLKSGLTTSNVVPVFVEGGKEAAANNRKLFIFTGSNAVQVLSGDGVTTTNLGTPPADWTGGTQPISGVIHEGRLWGLLNHIAYYSTVTDHENFTGVGSGTVAVFPGEFEKLMGAVSFKGALILWKWPKGIYLVDTSSSTIANWRVLRLSGAVGLASPLAALIVDDDILFMDENASFHLLSAVTAFGNFSTRNLSRTSDFNLYIRDNVNLAKVFNVRGVYYAFKREAHFAIAGSGATTTNRRIVIDFNMPSYGQSIGSIGTIQDSPQLHSYYGALADRARFRWSDRDICESLWMNKDVNSIPRLTSGDNAGFVWNMDQSTKSKAGIGYNGQFQIPHTDFSYIDPALATKRKLGDFLELVVEPTGNWTITADILWDGSIKQTITFTMGQLGAQLDTFTLDTDALAGNTVLNVKRRITGSGRRFSVIIRNNGAGQDFSISKIFLHFRPGDERN